MPIQLETTLATQIVLLYLALVFPLVLVLVVRKIRAYRNRGVWRDERRHVHKFDEYYGNFRKHSMGKRALLFSWLLGMALLSVNTLLFAFTLLKTPTNPILSMATQGAVIGAALLYFIIYHLRGSLGAVF